MISLTQSHGRSTLGIAHGIVLFLACTSLVSLFLVDGSIPIVRWALLMAALLPLGAALKARDGSLLLSPAYLLAGIVIFFYSVLPYAIAETYIAGDIEEHHVRGVLQPEIISYFGSRAESVVMGFGAAVLILHCAARAITKPAPPSRVQTISFVEKLIQLVAVIMAIVLLLVAVLTNRSGTVFSVILTAYLPIQSVILIYLIHQHRTSGIPSLAKVIFFAVVCILPPAVLGQGKIPVFIFSAAAIYLLSFGLPSLRKTLVVFFVGTLLFLLFVPTSLVIRENDLSKISTTTIYKKVSHVVLMKSFTRQTATGYCLKNIVDRHWDDALKMDKQFFWLEGMVPRVLWPEKPNLSHGSYYADMYCGRLKYAAHNKTHSSSITLLGQPIIMGGMTSLLLHGGILVFFLGGLTWIARRSQGLGRIFVFALLPWWIDFDQDYVLYAANLAKFALMIGCGVVVTSFISSRFARTP